MHALATHYWGIAAQPGGLSLIFAAVPVTATGIALAVRHRITRRRARD